MRLFGFSRPEVAAPPPEREIIVVMPPTNDPRWLALLHQVAQAGADVQEINRWLAALGKLGVWSASAGTDAGTSSAESAEEILRSRRERDRVRKQTKRREKQKAAAVRDRNAVTGNVTDFRASADARPGMV